MSTDTLKPNGWNEWANYVLKSLEDLKKQLESTDCSVKENKEDFLKAIGDLKADIRVLQTKVTQRATFTGALAGFIPSLAAFIYFILKNK